MRIRQGNDFIFLWAIERNGEPEDFSNALNIRLHFKNYDCVGEVKSFQIVDGNIVRVEVSPEWASRLGAYRLILSYEFENQSYSDGDQKCVVDVLAFNIVPKTSEADDVTEMAKTTDIMIGLKGDKGDPFTYGDFTPEQIEDLKRPAIEAAESVQIVENQISINEQGRVQAENERETAETTRVSNENNRVTAEQARVDAENLRTTAETSRETAEGLRVEAELLRQSNTQEAILNAEEATENANTAAQNADDARLAIQDDLALKANHGYESNPKTLKEVEDDTSVKVRNLITNGDFVNDVNGWSGVGLSVEHDSGRLRAYNWSTTYNRIRTPDMEGLSTGDLLYLRIGEYERSAIPENDNLISARINDIAPPIINEPNNPNLIIKNLSGIAAYNGETPRIEIRTYQGSGNSVWIDDVVCINLTETFGAGNEPTKEEFELLLDILGIDYFEEEINIPAQKIMQWQLALIRKNKNAIIALGGTII